MANKKMNSSEEKTTGKKRTGADSATEEEPITGEDSAIDPAIIEDTFTEEFSEYNDVDNF